MQNFHQKIFGGILGLLALAAAPAAAEVVFTATTGVNGFNNNLQTIGTGSSAYQVDTNWQMIGFYNSYGLSRGDVFGSSVSNPNSAISSLISSPDATRSFGYNAYVNTGGNRPGWYNPGTGAQWIGPSLNENNGGTPLDPPGNYVFQLDLSQYINPNGGLVTVNIAGINADNHYEIAVDGSVSEQSFLAEAFSNQETWGSRGNTLQFSFSPKDGSLIDFIIANNNDQISQGRYSYQKNPTGFMVDGLVVSQGNGPTPAQDKLTSTAKLETSTAPGSGAVFHQRLVSAPEPSTWLTLAAFLAITLFQARRKPALATIKIKA